MPEQSYPPYFPASKIQPRMNVRWDDVNPQNGKLMRVLKSITMPAFEIAYTWLGYSEIVLAYNYSSSRSFAFKPSDAPSAPNYVLCVAYQTGGVVYRYKLWGPEGVIFGELPMYSGQKIMGNFRLEVWSVGPDSPAVQTTPVTVSSSIRGDKDYRYAFDEALAPVTHTIIDFQNTGTVTTEPPSGWTLFFDQRTILTDTPDWNGGSLLYNLVSSGSTSPFSVGPGGSYAIQVDADNQMFNNLFETSWTPKHIFFMFGTVATSGVLFYQNDVRITVLSETEINVLTTTASVNMPLLPLLTQIIEIAFFDDKTQINIYDEFGALLQTEDVAPSVEVQDSLHLGNSLTDVAFFMGYLMYTTPLDEDTRLAVIRSFTERLFDPIGSGAWPLPLIFPPYSEVPNNP